MDFTVKKYKQLLAALKLEGYHFQTFKEFIETPASKMIILRHDVDLLPHNSLVFARLQADAGVKGVYYFRAVPESWNEEIIKEIASLGHEVGYHYENLAILNGDFEKGIYDFEKNLNALRKLVPVSTICMHGSPLSKYDSKDLWKKYDYKKYNIIAEPYFDVDYNEVLYLTDTGRRWDGHGVNVRDRVNTSFNFSFHTTEQIINAFKNKELPDKVMFTFHPQRWNDNLFMWTKELILQNIKNTIKKVLYVKNTN